MTSCGDAGRTGPEVRNPLQAISLTLSNLREHLLPGGEAYVAAIFAEMERLNDIVGGILSFARPSPPVAVESALGTLCARAVALASERAAGRGVRLLIHPAPGEDRCDVDEGQLLQVLLNLLRNAVDASPPGGTVEVGIESAAARLLPDQRGRGPFWRIVVHDEGPGIPAEVRERLFDPFFTTKSDGTGLGLAICQKIVEEHGGAIHVATDAGTGTTFTVELPRRLEGIVSEPARG